MKKGKTTKNVPLHGMSERRGTTPGGREYIATVYGKGRKETVVSTGSKISRNKGGAPSGQLYVKSTRGGVAKKTAYKVGKSGGVIGTSDLKKGPTKPLKRK